MNNKIKYFLIIIIIIIEAFILFSAIHYVRKGRLETLHIAEMQSIKNEIILTDRFELDRGTYLIQIEYDNSAENSKAVIRDHDVFEGGKNEIVLNLMPESNSSEKEMTILFYTTDLEIVIQPAGAELNIKSVEIEQTSRGKKLDLIRIIFWMFILDCLIIIPMSETRKMIKQSPHEVIAFEVLRIISAMAVVLVHTASAGIRNSAVLYKNSFIGFSVYHTIPVFAVPCFFMISGAIFLNPEKKITIKKILKKYVPKVLCMYIFWSAVYAIYEMVFDDNYITLGAFVSKVLRGKDTLWFLAAIAGLYLLTPILRKIAEDKNLLKYTLILYVVFSFLPNMVNMNTCFLPFISIMNKFNLPANYAGYFLIGYYLYRYPIERNKRVIVYVCGFACLLYSVIGGILYSRNIGTFDEKVYNYHSLNVVVFSSAIFMFVTYYIKTKEKVISFGIRTKILWLSDKTAGIYVTHMLFNSLVYGWLVHCGYDKAWFSIPCTAIAVFCLSLIVVTAGKKIPFIRNFM